MNAILENVFEAIITTDQDGNIETINHAATQMFESSSDEILKSQFSSLLPETYGQDFDKKLSNYRENGDPDFIGTCYEVMAQRNRGTAFPIELIVSEMWLDKERKFIIIARDISQIKNKLSA